MLQRSQTIACLRFKCNHHATFFNPLVHLFTAQVSVKHLPDTISGGSLERPRLITPKYIYSDNNSPWLENNNQGRLPAHCESAGAAELSRGGQSSPRLLYFHAASPFITCSLAGCSCLIAVIQGDFLSPPPEQCWGLGGVFECLVAADY